MRPPPIVNHQNHQLRQRAAGFLLPSPFLLLLLLLSLLSLLLLPVVGRPIMRRAIDEGQEILKHPAKGRSLAQVSVSDAL